MDDFDELAAAEAQLADLKSGHRATGKADAIHSHESYAQAVASAEAYVGAIKARR